MSNENSNHSMKDDIGKTHKIQGSILAICAVILAGAIFVEIFQPPMPAWVYHRTDDTKIYQTLFTAQASMVAIILAIIALLVYSVNRLIFGMSVARYLMALKPLLPFQHRYITVIAIVLTAFNGILVALGAYNISVGVFTIVIVLMSSMAYENLKVMQSDLHFENEIRNYILSSKNFEHTTNTFLELNESIIAGDGIVFRRNIDFAKELIAKTLKYSLPKDIDELQDMILMIIRTASETNFSNAAKILDLYITAFENVNEIKDRNVVLNKLVFRDADAYELLGKTLIERIIEEGEILNRWQYNVFKHISINDDYINLDNKSNIAASLYHKLNNNAQSARIKLLKLNIDILYGAQKNIEHFKNSTIIANNNYVTYVVTLFENHEIYLLNKLFGLDNDYDDESGFKQLFRQDGNFHRTQPNVFIMLYVYYLAYRESLVNDQEKDYCKHLLEKTAPFYWGTIIRSFQLHKRQNFSYLKTLFLWCKDRLHKHERLHEHHRGIQSAFRNVEYIVLDFFVFSLTRLPLDKKGFEDVLKFLLSNDCDEYDDGLYHLFSRYLSDKMLENYKQFCSIMQNDNREYDSEEHVNEEYDKLKSTAIRFFGDWKYHQAIRASNNFVNEQTVYENRIKTAMMESAEKFCNQFKRFDKSIEPRYETYTTQRMELLTSSYSYFNLSDDDYASEFTKYLNKILFEKIKPRLKLLKTDSYYNLVTDFLGQTSGIEFDLLIGRGMFRFNDPEYDKYAELTKHCTQVKEFINNIFAALDSRLIQVAVDNISVTIRPPTPEEMARLNLHYTNITFINGVNIFPDERNAFEYLCHEVRFVTIKADIACDCLENIVGGGLLFEKNNIS